MKCYQEQREEQQHPEQQQQHVAGKVVEVDAAAADAATLVAETAEDGHQPSAQEEGRQPQSPFLGAPSAEASIPIV